MPAILHAKRINKNYGHGSLAEHVLRDVSLALHRSQAVCLLGPSGSGKTTLLSILGCLLSPSAGELAMNGHRVDFRDQRQLVRWRREFVGFVFQSAQLLPFLTVEENLRIAGRNAGLRESDLRHRIDELLEYLGVMELRRKRPHQCSGGQRQRVAIARAILHRPPLIIADEPSAALDRENGQKVVGLLVQQARHYNAALLVVTHDNRLAPLFDRQLLMDSGRVYEP